MGLEKIYKGQRYVYAGCEDRINSDGRVVVLSLWRTGCAECGKAVVFKSVVDPGEPLRGPTRRCREHARPGIKASVRFRAE